jgi:hypothetical protein
MVQAPGHLYIGGSAYFVWADPPNGGCTARRLVAGHRRTPAARSTSKPLWVKCEGDLAQGVGPPNSPWGTPSTAAPQARGVYGLHRHVEYPTVADTVIEISTCMIAQPHPRIEVFSDSADVCTSHGKRHP